METEGYTYTTSKTSEFYGLSHKGLSFYEEKGIISPLRDKDTNYRSFTLDDCYNLYFTKLLSNCRFTLSEAAEMINGDDVEQFLSHMSHKRSDLEWHIKLNQRILFHSIRIQEALKQYSENPSFKVVSSPNAYRLFVRKYYEEHLSSKEQSQEFEYWNSMVPINTASLKYSLDDLRQGETKANVDIGNIILEEDFKDFEYRKSERVEFLPSQQCLYALLACDSEKINEASWLNPALDYMKENNLECTGGPISSMLWLAPDGHRRIRYEQVYFPLKESS